MAAKSSGSASQSTSGGIDPTSFQLQMKHNNEELQDYLKDLGQWEDEIKKKEAFLLKQKPILKKVRLYQPSYSCGFITLKKFCIRKCHQYEGRMSRKAREGSLKS